ncbi:Di-copper centre-containing protein [Wallemia mellicola]|nr:Di-copper centre-containing protein [Wallemia mellicola]
MKFSALSVTALVAVTNASPLSFRGLFGGDDKHKHDEALYLLGHSEKTKDYKVFSEADNVPSDVILDHYPLPNCKDGVKERKNWAHLSYDERKNFVDAFKCLRSKESWNLDNYMMSDRLADFIRIHQWPGADIHWVASFLPWHRGFTLIYEQQLQECGLEGTLPYWAWENDYADVTKSAVWDGDMDAGLGSFGHTDESLPLNASLITDGAIADYEITYPWPHKIGRRLRSNFAPNTPNIAGEYFERGRSPEWIKYYQSFDNYLNFSTLLEGYDPLDARADWPSSHGSAHLLTGGDMATGDVNNTSPADVLFFLHHANVDRHWMAWQLQDPENRLYQYEGNTQYDFQTGIRGGVKATLDQNLYYGDVPGQQGIAIKHLMDLENSWCTTYTDLDKVVPKFWEARTDAFSGPGQLDEAAVNK